MITFSLGHSLLKLDVSTGIDLTDAVSQLIKYKNNSTEGTFTATIEDALKGVITYEVQAGDLDVLGIWTLWAYITMSDGSIAKGRPFQIKVVPEGQPY